MAEDRFHALHFLESAELAQLGAGAPRLEQPPLQVTEQAEPALRVQERLPSARVSCGWV